MTTLNTRMPRPQNRIIGMLGASLAVALVVAGCSSPAPQTTEVATTTPGSSATPTSTPTPSAAAGSVEEPQNEEEAVEGATGAAAAYYVIRTEIEVDHPDDSSAIDTVAVGSAAERVHVSARAVVERGMTLAGSYSYEVTADSYASTSTSPDGTVYPFGTAHLVGCVDSSAMSATNPDGSPVEGNPNRRGIIDLTVVYYPSEKAWLVQDVQAPDEIVPC